MVNRAMSTRKIVYVLLVLTLTILLCACSNSETERAVREKIQGVTYYGRTTSESGTGSIVNKINREHKYWITFNEDGSCTATYELTVKYDEKYQQKNLRGKTVKDTSEFEGKWTIKAKESEATVTVTYTESVFEVPTAFTVTLDSSGRITSFVGVNKHSEDLKTNFQPWIVKPAE